MMRILFIYQNFQDNTATSLALAAKGGIQIIGLGINPLTEPLPNGVYYKRYHKRCNTPTFTPGASTQKPNTSVARHAQQPPLT